MPSVRGLAAWGLGTAWVGAVVAGFALLHRFETKPGPAPTTPLRWPAAAGVALDPRLPTLLLFAHPQCACTAATIDELNGLLAHGAGRVRTTVLFYSDPALGSDWAHSGSWDAAASLPGVRVLEDPLGATARLFGAQTSGETCLYAPDGSLLFAGGITAARGHVGANAGVASLSALILGAEGADAAPRSTPVFGCSLLGPRENSP